MAWGVPALGEAGVRLTISVKTGVVDRDGSMAGDALGWEGVGDVGEHVGG